MRKPKSHFSLAPPARQIPPQRDTFQQQMFDKTTLVLRAEVLREASDKMASIIVAEMVLIAVINVTIFLVLG